jgi:hypothetical protein
MRNLTILVGMLVVAIVAVAQNTPEQTSSAELKAPTSCKVFYSVLEEDALHNVNQGLLEVAFHNKQKNGLKWLVQMYRKYPDICYVAPNTDESVEFVIIASPAVYHGTRVEDSSHTVTNSSGQAQTDDYGNPIQTTSSVAVPYEVNYNVFTLTVERKKTDGHFEPLRRFQIPGLYRTVYFIPFGKGRHPLTNVIEDAIKWIHGGGLNNPMETIAK